MTTARAFLILSLITAGCSGPDRLPVVPDPTVKVDHAPKTPLELTDLSKVPPLDPKGRFQDGQTADGQPNQVAKDIVANGKDSIPFLIGKLDSETEIDHRIINYWSKMFEGDLALVILIDLFTDKTETNSTIAGFGYDDFLERGSDRTLMGEEVLRRYIQKHGRAKIKQRWQQLWDQKKDKIFWDEKCYCFRAGA